MRTRRSAIIAALAVTAAVGFGCGSAAKPASKGTVPPVGGASAGGGKVAEIGSVEGFTFSDGLVVSVLAASKFVPSATAIGLMPDHIGVKIQVQITNGSQNPVDLVLTTVHVSYGVAGYPAESIFDTASGIGSGFEGQVAPGKTATAWYGFSVSPDGAGDLSIEVSPAFSGYDSVLFSGGVSQG